MPEYACASEIMLLERVVHSRMSGSAIVCARNWEIADLENVMEGFDELCSKQFLAAIVSGFDDDRLDPPPRPPPMRRFFHDASPRPPKPTGRGFTTNRSTFKSALCALTSPCIGCIRPQH